MKRGSIKEQFKMPAAHAVGDVAAQGKEAQQRAQFNVQHAGFKHRTPAAGALGWLGMAASSSRSSRPVFGNPYRRSSSAPAPYFYGLKTAA